MDERPGDGHALLLASRKLRGQGIDARPHVQALQHERARWTAVLRGWPAMISGKAAFSAAVSAGNRLYC